jgi:hypothetical protein
MLNDPDYRLSWEQFLPTAHGTKGDRVWHALRWVTNDTLDISERLKVSKGMVRRVRASLESAERAFAETFR